MNKHFGFATAFELLEKGWCVYREKWRRPKDDAFDYIFRIDGDVLDRKFEVQDGQHIQSTLCKYKVNEGSISLGWNPTREDLEAKDWTKQEAKWMGILNNYLIDED